MVFFLSPLPPPPEQLSGMGNRSCSQFIAFCLHYSFLCTLFLCSGMGSLPQDTVLHELQRCWLFSKSCPSMGQSFRNRLFQCGSPTGSQILPEYIFLCTFISIGHSFCQEPAPARALHRVPASFRACPPDSVWGPLQSAVWIFTPPWPSMVC